MKQQICTYCTYYHAYYCQRSSSYLKQTCGYCFVQRKQCKMNETCERFTHDKLREKRRENSLYFNLESTAKSLNDIINMIKELEQEKNKNK